MFSQLSSTYGPVLVFDFLREIAISNQKEVVATEGSLGCYPSWSGSYDCVQNGVKL